MRKRSYTVFVVLALSQILVFASGGVEIKPKQNTKQVATVQNGKEAKIQQQPEKRSGGVTLQFAVDGVGDLNGQIGAVYLYVFNDKKLLEQVIEVDDNADLDELRRFQNMRVETTDGMKYFFASLNAPMQIDGERIGQRHVGALVLSELLNSKQATTATNSVSQQGNFNQNLTMTGLSKSMVDGRGSIVALNFTRNYAKVDVAMPNPDFLKGNIIGLKNPRFSYSVHNLPASTYATNSVDSYNYDNTSELQRKGNGSSYYVKGIEGSYRVSTRWEDSGVSFVPENIVTPVGGDVELDKITYLLLELDAEPVRVYGSNGLETTYRPGMDLWVCYKGKDSYPKSFGYMTEPKDGYVKWYDSREAAEADDGTPICYPKGKIYYRIDVANRRKTDLAERYSILRNSAYRIPITSLAGLGTPNPEELAGLPGQKTKDKSNLKSVITIDDWNNIYDDEFTIE